MFGNSQFENRIVKDVESGLGPDIASFPQPGLLRGLAKEDKVVDLDQSH